MRRGTTANPAMRARCGRSFAVLADEHGSHHISPHGASRGRVGGGGAGAGHLNTEHARRDGFVAGVNQAEGVHPVNDNHPSWLVVYTRETSANWPNPVLPCMNENQRHYPIPPEPLLQQPHEHRKVEQPANPPRRAERDALHASHNQPVRADAEHHSLSPSPQASATQPPASPTGVPLEHRLLTTAEAAAWFQVTERTVEAWRAKRLLPFTKIGRTVRFRLADLLQALDDRFLVKRRQ